MLHRTCLSCMATKHTRNERGRPAAHQLLLHRNRTMSTNEPDAVFPCWLVVARPDVEAHIEIAHGLFRVYGSTTPSSTHHESNGFCRRDGGKCLIMRSCNAVKNVEQLCNVAQDRSRLEASPLRRLRTLNANAPCNRRTMQCKPLSHNCNHHPSKRSGPTLARKLDLPTRRLDLPTPTHTHSDHRRLDVDRRLCRHPPTTSDQQANNRDTVRAHDHEKRTPTRWTNAEPRRSAAELVPSSQAL